MEARHPAHPHAAGAPRAPCSRFGARHPDRLLIYAAVSNLLVRFGNVVFRTRNLLFPVVLGAVFLVFRPAPLAPGAGTWAAVAAGVALLLAGQTIRVVTIGFAYIKRGGKDGRIYANDLVTGGVFAHCRNPMYLGNLLLVAGYLALAGNAVAAAVAGAFFVVAYAALILAEERYLAGRFGPAYAEYCAAVPRLRLRLRGLRATLHGHPFDWRKVVLKEHGTIYLTVMLAIGIFAWRGRRAAALGPYVPALATVAGLATLAYVGARIVKKSGMWRRRAPAGGA